MTTSLFAAPLYAPRFYAYDANGNPLAGGTVAAFTAGTSAPVSMYGTYTDALAGTNAIGTTVTLDASGSASIFLPVGAYKFTVKDSGANVIYTVDNVYCAQGYPQPFPTEWVIESGTATFVNASQFKFTGVDKSAIYHAGRRIRTTNTGGTVYSTVSSVVFTTDTTLNLVNDSGSLDAGLSAVAYGWTSFVNPSYLDPRTQFSAVKSGNQGAASFAASTKITTWTVEVDTLSEWVAGNNNWVAKYPGKYLITAQVTVSDSATATAQLECQIAKNGSVNAAAQENQAVVNVPVTIQMMRLLSLNAGDTIAVNVQALTGTSSTVAALVSAVPATILTIARIA